MRAFSNRRGITVLDVLAAIAIIAILASLSMGQLAAARERARRIKCASNLRQIGQGLMLYAVDSKAYPRVRYDHAPGAKMNAFTGAYAKDPFGADGPTTNDITAAIFLLVRNCDLSTEVFICPTMNVERVQSDRPVPDYAKWKKESPQNLSNFPGPEVLDYSIAQPYADDNAIKRGYKWSGNVSADWAIAADANPGGQGLIEIKDNAPAAELRKVNSLNHQLEGQNVLYNDGHCEWSVTIFAGANKDNIFTRAKVQQNAAGEWVQLDPPQSEEGVQPAWELDSLLLPTPDMAPKAEPSKQ